MFQGAAVSGSRTRADARPLLNVLSHERIHAVVSRIPRGRVATYGQVARLSGAPEHARLVGYALASLPEGSAIPWHRVVNARGEVSEQSDGSPMAAMPSGPGFGAKACPAGRRARIS